jgi:poly(3-hydroxybutyrate) depolymerase
MKMKFMTLCASLVLASQPSLGWAQAAMVSPEAPQQQSVADVVKSMTGILEQGPDSMGLRTVVQRLTAVSTATPEAKAEAEAIVKDAAALPNNQSGEARRRYSHAIALLLGRTWNAGSEYGYSIALQPGKRIFDPALPMIAQLSQRFPVAYKTAGALRLRVSLIEAGIRTASDAVVPLGKEVKEVGTYSLPKGDLIDQPFRFAGNIENVPEGAYMAVAEVFDGDVLLGRSMAPVHVLRDLEGRHAAYEKRLAKIQGHNSTKATVLYPFDLARGLDAGTREVTSYDFPAGLRTSEELLKALEAGKDPLFQGKGDNKRNYQFAEAGVIVPYRIFVPSTWTPQKHMPVILAIHGMNLDENNMITRGDGVVVKLAERYGYIVASPLEYKPLGTGVPGPSSEPVAPGTLSPAQMGEKDDLNVLEAVAKEYNVDRSRIYIMGNSAGGGATWTVAVSHAELFAGMAPCSAQFDTKKLDFSVLKGMPVMGVAGEMDTAPHRINTKAAIERMKQYTDVAVYDEIKGGTHGSSIEIAMPDIFAFFNEHQKK